MNYEKHEYNIFPTNENDYKNIVKNMRENGYDITLPIIMFEGKILKAGTPEELVNDEMVRRVYLGQNFELRKKKLEF